MKQLQPLGVFLLIIVLVIVPQSTSLAQETPTGLITVWDVATGTEILTITPELPVTFAAFNTDQTRIVARTEDGAIQVWDATTGEPLPTVPLEMGLSESGLNAGQTQLLFVAGNTVHVWDANPPWEEVLTLPHDDSVMGSAWNVDETRILTWAHDGTIRVWDASTGEELMMYAPADESFRTPIEHAQWNADETQILASGSDGSVRVWDAISGEEQLILWHLVFWIGAQWSLDESRIMTRAHDDMLWHWDAETGEELIRIDPLGTVIDGSGAQTEINPYTYARWSPSGGHFLTWGLGDHPGQIQVWNVNDLTQPQTLTHEFPMMFTAVDDAQWNAFGGRILSRTEGAPGVGAVWVWDITSPDSPLLEGRICCGEPLGMTWSADETQVLVWGRLWHMCGCE